MAKTTLVLTDKSFRIVIPQHIRAAEVLKIGDTVEISIKKVMTRGAEVKAFKEQFDKALEERFSLLGENALRKLKEKVRVKQE